MTRDESIKYAKENILAYTSEMAEFKALAIEAIEKQMQNCEDCLHAGPLQISHNTVFCFEHSCAMSSDNCCRDWIKRLGERR